MPRKLLMLLLRNIILCANLKFYWVNSKLKCITRFSMNEGGVLRGESSIWWSAYTICSWRGESPSPMCRIVKGAACFDVQACVKLLSLKCCSTIALIGYRWA